MHAWVQEIWKGPSGFNELHLPHLASKQSWSQSCQSPQIWHEFLDRFIELTSYSLVAWSLRIFKVAYQWKSEIRTNEKLGKQQWKMMGTWSNLLCVLCKIQDQNDNVWKSHRLLRPKRCYNHQSHLSEVWKFRSNVSFEAAVSYSHQEKGERCQMAFTPLLAYKIGLENVVKLFSCL